MNKKLILPFSLAAITALALIIVLVGNTTKKQKNDVDPAKVRTDKGWVKGRVTAKHRSFQGIPYAAPPKGQFRWKPPQPAKAWQGVLDATKPSNPCPQLPTSYAKIASLEEDCLCLNVTTPAAVDRNRLKPVMVWIHGDGSVGAGHVFDPYRLVEIGDVVVVTINYRLGIFGGFGYPGLEGSGTFGLMDQQAALQWVQDNIASFGGDPTNVTLFGVSYGALSTAAQLMSPAAKGLFHKAILQSGFALMDMPAGSVFPGMEALPWFGWRRQDEIKELGTYIAGQLKSTDLESLRKLSVKDLLPFTSMFQMYGYQSKLLPVSPDKAFAKGEFHRIPVLAGNTLDEHRTFVSLFRILAGNPVTQDNYSQLLDSAFAK
jgi:para-nitrobenzyl esterase